MPPQPTVMTTALARMPHGGEFVRNGVIDVDADLAHHLDCGGIDLIGGFGAGGADLDGISGEVTQPSGGHLGAASVVDELRPPGHGQVVPGVLRRSQSTSPASRNTPR